MSVLVEPVFVVGGIVTVACPLRESEYSEDSLLSLELKATFLPFECCSKKAFASAAGWAA